MWSLFSSVFAHMLTRMVCAQPQATESAMLLTGNALKSPHSLSISASLQLPFLTQGGPQRGAPQPCEHTHTHTCTLRVRSSQGNHKRANRGRKEILFMHLSVLLRLGKAWTEMPQRLTGEQQRRGEVQS